MNELQQVFKPNDLVVDPDGQQCVIISGFACGIGDVMYTVEYDEIEPRGIDLMRDTWFDFQLQLKDSTNDNSV